MTSRLWCLTYYRDGLPYGLTVWGDDNEIKCHAQRLGMTIDGECVHIENAETGEIEYTTGGTT